MKVFAPRALGWLLDKVCVCQQTPKQIGVYLSAGRPGAIPVVLFATLPAYPLIQQCVARSGVETQHHIVVSRR